VATDVQSTTVEITVEPFATTMHVSDLDGAVNDLGRFWQAVVTITVLDDAGAAVPNATVDGTWSGNTSGSESVTTDTNGQATVISDKVLYKKDMVIFTVDNLTDPTPLTYDPADNTDPDGDSDGTTIIVWQTPPESLMATGTLPLAATAAILTPSQAEVATAQALAFWSTQMGIALPQDIHVQVANLPGNTLGWASGSTIVLDHNANGAGWYLEEDTTSGQFDLLTAATHEIGHLLGYTHSGYANDVMLPLLPVNVRRLETEQPLVTGSLLLPPEPQRILVQHDVIDEKLNSRRTWEVTIADIDQWLLPMAAPQFVEVRPNGSPGIVPFLDDLEDEETELLGDDVLDLIASDQL
jgi:hypothetical protein